MKTITKTLGSIAAVAVLASAVTTLTATAQDASADAVLLATFIEEGDGVYHSVGCSRCHGDNGEGGVGPTLAGNDYLSSRSAVVSQIMQPDEDHGGMPAFAHLSDREIAAVATYIRNAWGNEYGFVPEDTVERLRANLGGGGSD